MLIIHWGMNHRLESHLRPMNQPLLPVWRSCDQERRRGEEQKSSGETTSPAQVIPSLSRRRHLIPAQNSSSHNWTGTGIQGLYDNSFILYFSGCWDAFHHSSGLPVGLSLDCPLSIGPLIAWTCLARGNWSLPSCLRFSIHLLRLTFSQRSQPDWAPNLRSWSRGPSSATNPWGAICSQSHARRRCSWPRRRSGWGHSWRV